MLAVLTTGCAQLRIPTFDPTGQRIFGGTTTLAGCDLLHGHFHKHRDVAVAPPPCAPPVEVVPITPVSCGPHVGVPALAGASRHPPEGGTPAPQPLVAVPLAPVRPIVPIRPVSCGPQVGVPALAGASRQPPEGGTPAACADRGPELKITPSRIVAPVNTEVVLAAGLCGPQGYYITRQPLEWMLAQDGVGQIVAVGKESPANVSFLLRNSPQKVATNYARAHTSTISQVLDRGTKSPADDVFLDRGQSWISVTSPTEGTTHVVVWAPKEHNWERRKETATIYWVDAVWKFPPPVAARAGSRQTLTTTVMRSGGQPVAGWWVRYDVLEGPPAVLSAKGETAVQVRTDSAGRATAELLPRSTEPGITIVRVQVIRPASGRGDLPEMIVGQGQTSVSWSAPGLSVRALGPSLVAADGAVSYRVEVTNSGDMPTRGVTLSYTPPTGVSVLNSTPAAQVFGQRTEWRLGDLPARTTSTIELNVRAAVAASLRSTFMAKSADGLAAEGSATTEVFANALSVKMTGPDAVEVGREAKFNVEVTNIGSRALTNVTATDTFDPGLQHTQGEVSPIIRTFAQPLAPGESHRFAVSFNVTRPGQQCHRLDVTADGGHTASARGCVTGTQAATPPSAPARLSVRVSGPKTRTAGQVAEYFLEVRNTGTSAATNVAIAVRYGVNLELREATRGHQDDPRNYTTAWRIAQVEGGETITRQLNCVCLNPDDRATVQASVTSDQTRTPETAQAVTQILAAAAAPPVRPGAPPPVEPPAAGSLKVAVRDLADPIMFGAKTTYLIQLSNEGTVPDRDVVLTIQLSEGLKLTGITGPTTAASSTPDGRTIELVPIAEIRAGEQLPDYRLEVEGTKAGRQKLQVIVKSARSPAGVSAEAETTVNMP